MINYNLHDTIAAIGTGLGEAGIGIVRLSGKDALAIADKIFVAKDGKKLSQFKTYTTHYGWIVNSLNGKNEQTSRRADEQTEIVDEVILTVMRATKSYTKEDIVEINCHGGIVAIRAVLDLVLQNGARLADPGEFTKRAFLNGRIDLAQAEAVLDIIRAKTDSALKIGTEQLRGALSVKINNFRKILLETLAALEANIDFPEEEIGEVDLQQIRQRLAKINAELKGILESARYGRLLREGIRVVICGRPNVGKSSLLNALLKQERSIVTSVAGTTRDTIEEIIDIKGIPVRIVDTAGIIEPRDLVEKKAVQRAKRYVELADLVILLFDSSSRLTSQDRTLMSKLRKKAVLAVINKIDLKPKIDKNKISERFGRVIEISAKKMRHLDRLEEAIADLAYKGRGAVGEPGLVSNLRHIEALRQAEKLIAEALDSLDNKLSLEFIAQGAKEALGCFDNMLGKKFSEDLLDKIFGEFCIGK